MRFSALRRPVVLVDHPAPVDGQLAELRDAALGTGAEGASMGAWRQRFPLVKEGV